ncbi:MAG: flagellar protein [Lachnospiraceae bacterium]|nr:flagellar protein [Lachnospiraceae bacterium]
MDVRNCKDCGRLFNYIGGPRICSECRQKLEEKFQQVKRYIYDNKDAPISQVSEENDVSVQQIKQWVREERLSFTDESAVGLECESCGELIHTGRFCESCKKKLANNLGAVYKKEEPKEAPKSTKDKARMRFLDN